MRRSRRPGGYQVGERVVIVAGALRGMTGLVQERGADDRVYVALDEARGTLVCIHARYVRHQGPEAPSPDPRSR